MELAPGTVLAGRFVVDGPPIGAGASGVVWPATDRATGRAVAAKILHRSLTTDPGADALALARLQQEAALAGRLRHPRVVEVLGLHRTELPDGSPSWVLVSERFDGVALSSLGQLSPEATAALGLQLCEGLAAAHALGLVHGDVRPGNVLVGKQGAALFDFGVGRLEGGTAAHEATLLRAGETAPERHDGAPATVASDVYGLGVTLWYALHGELPFSGETPWAIIGAQRKPLPARSGRMGRWRMPWEDQQPLVELCSRMLHPDPVERPELGAVKAALVRISRAPTRKLRLGGRLPPFRPGLLWGEGAWVVHGIDPGTGARAVMAHGLSKRQARRLLARLRADGWTVRATRQAFDTWDLVWIGLVTLAGSALLSPVLAPLALILAVRWRADFVRPAILTALPQVSVPIPPRRAAPGVESAVVGGLLMLATAATLAWWPTMALLPGLLLVLLVISSMRPARPNTEQVARQGRVASALAELRTLLSTRLLPLEEALGLEGELDELERQFQGGKLDSDRVLLRVDELRAGVLTAPVADAAEPSRVLDALRRSSPARALRELSSGQGG